MPWLESIVQLKAFDKTISLLLPYLQWLEGDSRPLLSELVDSTLLL